ncbi:MAG: NUDIX domain-containing protein, partial [Acidobacteria bacterium]|nr:NUDIX domain-containing protein [Acidobacteriota bacterium]
MPSLWSPCWSGRGSSSAKWKSSRGCPTARCTAPPTPTSTAGHAPWLTELVAGIIEPGESAEDVARREAREEAGIELGELFTLQFQVLELATSNNFSFDAFGTSPWGSFPVVRCGPLELLPL